MASFFSVWLVECTLVKVLSKMKKPVQPQTSKSEKERVTVELDSMDGVISRLEDNSKRIQQFELWYCIVSLLAVFASLNNFELSEARTAPLTQEICGSSCTP